MASVKRICIYPKDIQRITGKSIRSSRTLFNEMRNYFEKEPHQLLTIYEFAQYTNIELEAIETFFNH